MTNNNPKATYADSKPHYELLDGLRGVAALLVIWYHVFEGFATSPIDQGFNHGYLAVDFFFILSGFVIGYAYDDRRDTMSAGQFLLRRLVRLHPMVIIAGVFGLISFCIAGFHRWDGTQTPIDSVMLAFVLGLLLLPALPGSMADVRGNNEMFSLNGPSWSLFFEYIANILYALFVRRLSTRALAILVGLCGAGLAAFSLLNLSGSGNIGVGWSLIDYNLLGGLLRVMFSFPMGLLLSRVFKPVKVRGAFWLCAVALAVLLAMPYVGSESQMLTNAIYDIVCVIVIFPAIVWLGASGTTTDSNSSRICKFLGDISYPFYIVHYPLMYLFYAWVWNNGLTFADAWPVAVAIFVGNILLSWLCLKLYDEPIRRWLSKKLLKRKQVADAGK